MTGGGRVCRVRLIFFCSGTKFIDLSKINTKKSKFFSSFAKPHHVGAQSKAGDENSWNMHVSIENRRACGSWPLGARSVAGR